MLNLLQKYRNHTTSKTIAKAEFAAHFIEREEHTWIQKHAGVKHCFEALFNLMPRDLVVELARQPFCFVPSNEFKSKGPACFQLRNTVVVFPEFERLLQEGAGEGIAFLAHEVALVLYELENPVDKDPLMAEVEADKFVCDLGLSEELERLLLAMDESTEKRMRLTHLTFNAFGIN